MIDKSDIESNLKELPIKLPEVRGVLVATLDGITVAATGVDEKSNQLAAMTASALALGKRMIEIIRAGDLKEISIGGTNGSIFVYALGAKAVLVVVTKENPNIAMVNWESRKLIEELNQIFG